MYGASVTTAGKEVLVKVWDELDLSANLYEFKARNLPSISGCTDEDSMLYNPFATSDNGTCDQGVCEGSYIGDYLNNHNENNGKNNKSFLYPMVRKKIKND